MNEKSFEKKDVECITDINLDTISNDCLSHTINYFLKQEKFNNLDQNDLIIFVKLSNTLYLNQSIVSFNRRNSVIELGRKNSETIYNKLNFKISKGMGMYSEKLDLYFGGTYEMMLKSSFVIR